MSLQLIWADLCFRARQPGLWKRTELSEVAVAPIEEMLMRWAGGSIWRGGPQCPPQQHCAALDHYRGAEAVGEPAQQQGWQTWPVHNNRLFWCGPICDHFGHQLGEFGGRVLLSSLDPCAGSLLFLHQDPGAEWWTLKPWQRDWIDYLNPSGKPVVISAGGFRARQLVVIPQQQRLGEPPTQAHLAALTRHSRILDGPVIHEPVVLSRSRHAPADSQPGMRGSFAGEQAFDACMAARGARIVYPETLALRELLELLHRATCLVVSEGSVLHAMELLGHQPQKRVVVMARRPLWPGMERPLRCRFPQLQWIDAVKELVWCEPSNPRVKGVGRLNWEAALSQLGRTLQWSFSQADVDMLERASDEQLVALSEHVALQRRHCGPEDRRHRRAGGW